ncbi:MAG: outer membrane protein assembly factor BamB [Gammaproteobacteria bacterium]|nr:outer membrane protein assembly factor BamB [Gammaproteobacteria bacterium]MDH3363237.1 outer membrane protein assembly factor BamB [Gammaproteobacteria bacterium]MDH3480760.1 outer membrane protein assembly factor BamB [Gammaproteobacteria bacterium]
MNKALRIFGVVTAALLLASCGIFSGKDKELEPKELADVRQSLKIKRLWSAKVGGKSEFLRVALQPAGDGNRIYAAGHDGVVSAFDPQSGKQIWRTKLGTRLSAGPGVGEGRVVVVSEDGVAISLDAGSGAEQWRVELDGESLARPLISGESVVVQTIDNRLRALSIHDGQELWAIEQSTPTLTMRGSADPVAVGSAVIGGFDNGRLVATNLGSGDILWESMLSPPKGRSDLDRLSDIDGSISVVGQDVYAAGYQGRLAAVASESGQVLWSREISSYEGVSADWNSVYTTTAGGEVVALSRRDGTETWRNDDLLRREPTLPVPFHTTVVVGDLEGYIHFLSNLNGTAVARLRLGNSAITAAPLVVADRLYVQSDSGSIGAYQVVEDRPKRQAPDIAADES